MDNQNFIVFGKPGSGKSTYLKTEIFADIDAGKAVVYIDPHGEDSRSLLDAIPKRRWNDVCYLDASDPDYAVGFQPLDAPHRLVAALRTIFKDSWGPRLEQGLRNALAAVFEANLTLHAVSPLFYDLKHRIRVVRKVSKPSTRDYWLELFPKAYNDRQQQEAASPIYNKLDAILASDISRHLTQKTPRLDLREAIHANRIIVVNLSTPTIGEDAALVLGSLFTTAVRNTLMSYPHPLSFYADEFQIYGTDVYLSMLRELRKFGLKLGLATQTAQGIDRTFLSIILGTVRDIILFNVSYEDADLLTKPFNFAGRDITVDLATLPPFTAYINGEKAMMPPFSPTTRGALRAITDQSRRRYARSIPPPAQRQAQTHKTKPTERLTLSRRRRRI